MRRWWLGALSAAFAMAALSSCAQLDRVRLQMKPDTGGAISFLVRASSQGLVDGRLPDDLVAEVGLCGFRGQQMERGSEVLVDAYLDFTNATALGRSLECLPLDWTKREIALVEETGLLYKTYIATIWLEQPTIGMSGSSVMSAYFERARAAARSRGERIAPEPTSPEPVEWLANDVPMMPLALTVDLPGGDLEIDNEISLPGFKSSAKVSSNRAEINLRPINDDARQLALEPIVEALNRGDRPPIPNDVYKVTITSHVARYELGTVGTIASIVGALFGSGVIVQLIQSLRRRNQPPPPPRRRGRHG